jgi:hypothetical protein
MSTLDEAWNGTGSDTGAESIEDAAAAMKAAARAKAELAPKKAKTAPVAVVPAPVAESPKPKRGRKPGVKVATSANPVDAIRASIARHKTEIANLKAALKMLKGAA